MTTVYSYGAGSPRAVTRDTNAPRARIYAVDALRVHHVGRGTTVEKTRGIRCYHGYRWYR